MPSAVFVQMDQRKSGNSSGHQKVEFLSSANAYWTRPVKISPD